MASDAVLLQHRHLWPSSWNGELPSGADGAAAHDELVSDSEDEWEEAIPA